MTPKLTRIFSENNDFQHIDALRRGRAARHRYGEFFLEGVRAINGALQHRWRLKSLVYSRDQPLSDWARGILADSQAEQHLELPLPLLARLSNKTEPSELLAVAAIPDDRLSRITVQRNLCVVVFDRPASPGNLGSIIRSCDALRAGGLVLTGHGADLYDPETISASTGSLFAVPVVRQPGPAELLPWFESVRRTIGSIQIIGTSAHGSSLLDAHDFTRPTVLVIGNETWGMSAAYRELCDVILRIPIDGSATSLNVASAASIMLYEIDRQRRAVGEATPVEVRSPLSPAP